MLIHAPDRADHAQGELRTGHLHAEHTSGFLQIQRDMFDDIHRQRGFAHRGPRGDHDQLARLQARCHAIKIDVTRGKADHVVLVFAAVEHVDTLDSFGQQRIDFDKALTGLDAGFSDLKHLGLGLVDQVLGFAPLRIKRGISDFAACLRQLAHDGAFAHDLGVAADIGRARRIHRQRAQIRLAACLVEFRAAFKALGYGQHVGRAVIFDQQHDVLKNQPVISAIKICFADDVGNLVPRRVFEQQATQYRLLGLDRLRRHPHGLNLRIERHIGETAGGLHGAHGVYL